MLELPRLVAEVAPELAMTESPWMEGPRRMASALGTDIPVKATQVPFSKPPSDSFTDHGNVSRGKTADQKETDEKDPKHREPMTGTQVVEILSNNRHLGKFQFFHLQAVNKGTYRPYDLHVVPWNRVELESREAVMWKALQNIPFFRDYLLRKAFIRWYRNVCKITLQRRCKVLQGLLLMAVPQFRDALFNFSSLIEEFKGVHWLPQDECKTYTLLDFQNTLMNMNQESRGLLERILQYRAFILNTVRKDSYGAHQELQLRVDRCQLYQQSQSMHLQVACLKNLRKELHQAENVLQRLGNMATLIDQMIVQSLVTIIQREVSCFLNNVIKRDHPEKGCLFQAELIFGADGQLTLFPPIHLLQEVLQEALLSVADSALQVLDACSDTRETESASTSITCAAPEHSLVCSTGTAAISALGEKDSERTGVSSFSSQKEEPQCAQSTPGQLLPKQTPLRVQGQRLREQYYPLSRTKLEWQLSLNTVAKVAQREQARITQEAQCEIQQLCEGHSWLVDIYLFISQWGPSSLELIRGKPAVHYEEYIQKVRCWIDKVRSVSPSLTTTNKLLLIHFSHIQEKIAPLLNSIEEDLHALLVLELKLHSENLILKLKLAVEGLRVEPTNLNDFSQYASMVKCCPKMSDEIQQQLGYLHSLQETVCTNYGRLSQDELLLEEQMLELWNTFVPLAQWAAEKVGQLLPTMAKTLDNTFSSLAHDLEEMLTKATSGLYVDPSQDAALVSKKLKDLSRQVNAACAGLEDLSRTSKSIRGNDLDLSFVKAAEQMMEARKGVWELMAVSSAQIHEWKLLLFSKFVVSRAQEKVSDWLQQAVTLSRTLPTQDAVLQETLRILEQVNQQLPVLAKLSSPSLQHKHWRNIFKGVGQSWFPEWNFTVADLMSRELREHQDKINTICWEANAELEMEQEFRKLQAHWEVAVFELGKFIVTVWEEDKLQLGATWKNKPNNVPVSNYETPKEHSFDSGTFTIMGLETLVSQTEDSVMTLSNMMLSPHVADFRQEVEHWVLLLQELEELLGFIERYQQKWVFLSKTFYETAVGTEKVDLLEMFHPVDKTFREMIQTTLTDPHVLNIVRLKKTAESTFCFYGHNLHVLLRDGLNTMECISNQLLDLLDSARSEFPRLCFLSDVEVIKLLSLPPTPSALLPLVRRCFPGVRWLETAKSDVPPDVMDLRSGLFVPDTHLCVRGVYGSLREHVPFHCSLEPNLNPVGWLCLLEQHLQQAMALLMKQCAVARQQSEELEQDLDQKKEVGPSQSTDSFSYKSPLSSLRKEEAEKAKRVNEWPLMWSKLSDYPLQCLLVVEEALWCSEVRMGFYASTPVKWPLIKAKNASKLQSLGQAIRDGFTGDIDKSMTTHRMVTVLRSLLLLTMNQSQQLSRLMELKCDLESSFEWQSLMKYHLVIDKQTTESITQKDRYDSKEQLCYVEILGMQLPYCYEYLGPEHLMIVNTPSTERARLGILLALTSYRCGFVSGLCMSGKRKTVVQLGRALGLQVISMRCCVNTCPSVVQKLLSGALQTGAWLVLDSVDLMTQGVLSQLGQHLSDIQKSLSFLQSEVQQKNFEPYTEASSGFSYPNDNGTVSAKVSHGSFQKECETSNEVNCQISFAGKSIFAKLSYGCVIIASRGYRAEVPENLRVVTRPISLAHPDYSIITEVMLASLGFTEAVSLSRRLISIFRLAKDSLCLPDSVSGEQLSWMVLLRNTIAASGSNLRRTSRLVALKKKVLEKPGDVVVQQPETEGDEGPQSFHYKQDIQSAALMQAVAEEQAVVYSVLSILQSANFQQKKAFQFRSIFEEIFPMAHSCSVRQKYVEEEREQSLLMLAITEELQRAGLHADTRALCNALKLYQALRLSQGVLLVGPAGSGKTTCYRALAGALRKLAARTEGAEFDEDLTSEGDVTNNDYRLFNSNWSSVETVVIFPNALSHEELFGGSYDQQGSWRDGAFTKVLRDLQRHDFSATSSSKSKKKCQTKAEKWVVMDGEPLGQPGWLDPFITLCNPEDPFLYLSMGERFKPSLEELKLLAEVSDLADAAPSAVTRCNMVYLSGTDMWKAVWTVEMEALYREPTLDQGTMKMWNRLAEDLFSSTLAFIRQQALSPVMHGDGDGSSKLNKSVTCGLQEVNSFIRILHALLKQFGKGWGLEATPRTNDTKEITPVGAHLTRIDALIPSSQQEIHVRNLFLVAFIWGFGGHLHPRHWPHFDLLARKLLLESRYRVEVPPDGTVFEHFFNLSEAMTVDTTNPLKWFRTKSRPMAYTTVAQYEKHAYMLDLMLEAHQPALLVGEAGSGKTTLCQSLLCRDRPHIRLPATSRLRYTDLRSVLENIGCQKSQLGTTTKQPGLLLFLDDLHEAPCDAFGKTSMALETLRQCISLGGILTSDRYHFKLFGSGLISYFATCRTFGAGEQSGCNQFSFRLFRLFSVLALPSLSVDVLFSIHSPQLQNWLKEFPCMSGYADMAYCIITATLDLYHDVRERFQPDVHRPHFLFSMRDLGKVFQGMCLWAPGNSNRKPPLNNISHRAGHSSSALSCFSAARLGPAANVLNIARLWMHECLRTFGDRLCSEDEGQAMVSLMAKVSERNYSSMLTAKPQTARAEKSCLSMHSETLKEQEGCSDRVSSSEGCSDGVSSSEGCSDGVSSSEGCSDGVSSSEGCSDGVSSSEGCSDGVSSSEGCSDRVSSSEGCSDGVSSSEGCSDGVNSSEGCSDRVSSSEGCSDGVSSSEGCSDGVSSSEGCSDGVSSSEGCSDRVSSSEGCSDRVSISEGCSDGVSSSEGCSDGVSSSEGCSDRVSSSEGCSDREQQKRKKPQSKEKPHLQTNPPTSSSHQALDPSPPKGPKPVSQTEWKRSHKLCDKTPQAEGSDTAEPSPENSLMPIQLLQNMQATIHSAVFSTEPLYSTSQQHHFKRNSVYLERDPEILVQQLASSVGCSEEEKEEAFDHNHGSTCSYIVHRQSVCQLAHILRALLIPGGHGALFGAERGTGRKTTVRLAAYLTGYQLIEVHPGNESQLGEMLREAGGETGVHGGNVILLVHEEASAAARDALLVLMADGTLLGLYSEEEMQNLLLTVNAPVKNPRCHLRDDQGLEKYFRQIQRNVHVFLLMTFSPCRDTGLAALGVAQMTKALSLCCCVDMYQPWSTQSLVEAASCLLRGNRLIPDTDSEVGGDGLVCSISRAMAGIHQSACQYASILLPDMQPFSPQDFVEMSNHFLQLCSHLSEQHFGQANRLSTILARVKEMSNTPEQHSQEVARLKEKCAERQQCLYHLQRDTDAERTLCKRARKQCLLEENRLAHLEQQHNQAQQQADNTFKEVSPLYQTALNALQSLSPADLHEVQCYRFPPEGVVLIMDAICLLFRCPRNWESSKKLLGQSNFFQELEFYDRSTLNDDLFHELGQIVQQPAFLPESVRGVSRACESLCRWVRAVYQYACVQRLMAPQQAWKNQLDMRMAESRAQLRMARLQEAEALERLEDMERQQQYLRQDLDELAAQVQKAETLEREAATVVQQLQGHFSHWTAEAQETEMNNQTISGDALLLAATMTYLGPFVPDVRTELVGKWRELCLTGHINILPEDPRTSVDHKPAAPGPSLHVPIPTRAELDLVLTRAAGVKQCLGLRGHPSLVLQVVLWGHRGPWATRWPLLVNVQQHEDMMWTGKPQKEDWLAQTEGGYELVVSADDPVVSEKVRQGAEKGWQVLVTHLERAVPSPEFLEMLVRPSGSRFPGDKRPSQTAHPEFNLFLSTRLPVRHALNEIHPSVLSEVRVVDLALSSTEVQELMMTELVQFICPELWDHHRLLKSDKQALLDKLHQEEVSLMEYILQTSTPLPQDTEFPPQVSACWTASQNLQVEVTRLSLELQRHKQLLAELHRVAGLASSLYQSLQDVALLSTFYIFPLRNFLLTVRGALVSKGRPDVTSSGEVVTSAVMNEVAHRMVTQLLAQYRPCLFQRHAALLRLLVSVALAQHVDGGSEVERMAFLRGLEDVGVPVDAFTLASPLPSTTPPQGAALPSWLRPDSHTELLRLQSIPAFTGLLSSLAASPSQWQEYLSFPSSTVVGPVPCRSHAHLSTMQRALLWKTVLPHWLAAVADDLAACHFGQLTCSSVPGAPHTGSPDALSRFLNKHEGPIIVILPIPGRDGWASIQPLHWIKKVAQYQAVKTVVKVISFGAKCQKEAIILALQMAAHHGHWLVLNNCHLLDQWDQEVVCQISQVISCAAKEHQSDVEADEDLLFVGPCAAPQVHPSFRLWFITKEGTPLSIPASVRMCALRLACDSPWDVKEELCSSVGQVVSRLASTAGVRGTTFEPQLRCAILHSVLLQRQAYKHLGQGSIYHWTQEDLLALLDAQVQITKVCSDPTGALEYIAAKVVYGGHVSDGADLAAVECVSGACLREAPSVWGTGPHTLSDIIHIPGCFESSGLLQNLEHRVQALANASDPLLLGFSAGLAGKLVKAHSHTLNTLLQECQNPFVRIRSINKLTHPVVLPDFTQARDRLQVLKDGLGHKEDIRVVSVGAPSIGPLRNFLQAEWDCLLDVVGALHSELNQPMPNSKFTVSSLLSLSTLFHLEKRAELLKAYLTDDSASGSSNAYHLSAFSNARGFLAAIIREAARAKQLDISNVSLDFQVLSAATTPSSCPLSGVYLCGLELRGAVWVTRFRALHDTLSPQPCLLPLLWVRAQVRKADTARAPDGSPGNSSALPVYNCPLYLDGHHENGTDGELAENNIIVHIPLETKLDPLLCTLRRVRLVSTL
ncbi:hypothetical protein UPYG_G00199950 [Umbra pygmaea]|uniref:AAA+ ATPase domain-containing protein n=1 Tax=Umbra pygmaea TaxID=75934 RepID=A0ABD0X445_UMBPY